MNDAGQDVRHRFPRRTPVSRRPPAPGGPAAVQVALPGSAAEEQELLWAGDVLLATSWRLLEFSSPAEPFWIGPPARWLGESDDPPGLEAALRKVARNRTRDRLLVLVAEDEPIIAETLIEILNGEGFEAISVPDGESAVETAHRLRPDVVLSDVVMPRLNGVEVAKQIRRLAPETRVILFSGQAETAELLTRARADGHHFEVLAKPVRPTTLLKMLRGSSDSH